MIRVLLADDQHLVRQGIRSLLDLVPDIEVAGEAPRDSGFNVFFFHHDYDLRCVGRKDAPLNVQSLNGAYSR